MSRSITIKSHFCKTSGSCFTGDVKPILIYPSYTWAIDPNTLSMITIDSQVFNCPTCRFFNLCVKFSCELFWVRSGDMAGPVQAFCIINAGINWRQKVQWRIDTRIGIPTEWRTRRGWKWDNFFPIKQSTPWVWRVKMNSKQWQISSSNNKIKTALHQRWASFLQITSIHCVTANFDRNGTLMNS